jgi:ubiquinone/menaquinone biosynthesis C-methylase UbiE
MKQVDIPELLDTDSGSAGEIASSLLDIREINRRFGGVSTMQSMVERISWRRQENSYTVLEVASGAGYVPEAARKRLERRGIHLKITLLDRARSHLPTEAQGSSLNNQKSIPVVGDARALPFANSTFDLVDCTLFAHHLLPGELVKFVNEGLRVCRIAVLINDIVRHPVHLGLVYAALPLFRSRITRHDAVVSVRRAYTPQEMKGILEATGAASSEIRRHYLFRMGAIAWKQ